jgi:2-methylcitrate dehydratase
MSTVNRSLRAISRFPVTRSLLRVAPVAAFRCIAASTPKLGAARIGIRGFSSTKRRDSGAPVEMGQREYDPEIRDIADYVHNKKIDSELAVCVYFVISTITPCLSARGSPT